MRNTYSPIDKMLKGAFAGMLATLPMTIFMLVSWLRMPARELHPLPPRQITRKLLREAGLHRRISQSRQNVLTWLLHFLYGAAFGSLYGIISEKIPGRDPVKGLLAGTALWSGSYLGWIPLLGIMPPATKQPWRMNVLMIVAHFIWGITLGMFNKMWSARKLYIEM